MNNVLTVGQITEPRLIEQYIFGGHGAFTIQSNLTNKHFTYEVRPAQRGRYFLRVRYGSDGDSQYLGIINREEYQIYQTRKSELDTSLEKSLSFKAISWLLSALWHNKHYRLQHITFLHNGTCGRCGRELTHPDSIATGIGPVCAGRS